MKIKQIVAATLVGALAFTGTISGGNPSVEAASKNVLTKDEQRALFFSHLVYHEKDNTYNEMLSSYKMTSSKPKYTTLKKEIESSLPKGISYASFSKSLDLDSYYSRDLVDNTSSLESQIRKKGLEVKLYRSFNPKNPTYVAVRGTQSMTDKKDLTEDLKFAIGGGYTFNKPSVKKIDSQASGLVAALAYASISGDIRPNEKFYLVGHSLGGRLAHSIGMSNKIKTISFSTPHYIGVDRDIVTKYLSKNKSYRPSSYHANHFFNNDALTMHRVPNSILPGDNHVYSGTNHSIKGYYEYIK